MYSDLFCKIYNEFGWNYFPEAFGEQLLEWLHLHNLHPRTCVDLACGPGILAGILKENGIDASGMDLSEGMIKTARGNYPDIHFEVADMITYRPDRQFDLVTSTGDAFNHIMDLADVEIIFQNVFGYLSEKGYFIFNMLSEKDKQEVEAFDFPYDEHISGEFSIHNTEDGRVNLKTRVFEDGKFQFEENIWEKFHDVTAVCGLLEKTGFQVLQCDDRLLPDQTQHSSTWYIIAQKK